MFSKEETEFISALFDGECDQETLSRLKDWLRKNPSHIDVFVQQACMHQELRELLSADASSEYEEGVANQNEIDEAAQPAKFPGNLSSSFSWPQLPTGLMFVFAVALLLSNYITFRLGHASKAVTERLAGHVPEVATDAALYEAKLVKVTNCLWDSTRCTANLKRDSQISPGESLCLLEGVAEINSVLPDGRQGKFILEGPVTLMMTSQGVPSLQYGKLSVTVSGQSDFFALDTSLGSIVTSSDASFGILSCANKVELHVFAGSVTFEPAQVFSALGSAAPLKVAVGSCLRLSLGPERTIAVQKGIAKEEDFITTASMNASHLNIPESYITAIKQAKPVAYWRFDRVRDDLVPNEMGDRFACRVQGPLGWRTYPNGNRTAEFSMSTQPGFLMTDDDLGEVLKDHYSVEFWMKPDYCQFGSVFSLVKGDVMSSAVPVHGVLVELSGPAPDPSFSPSHVERIRFLHRSPPNSDPRSGTSCYSDLPYTPRIWQHLAAVKDGSQLKLYLDGKLVAQACDTTDAPLGLRVLMGQLYGFGSGPNAAIRPFVGELDEVALYDRALTPTEINKHIALVRAESTDDKSW